MSLENPAVGRGRESLWRYSPGLILLAVVIADGLQHSGADLWGHVLWGQELLAHGSLPRINPYSYSAPGYPWLRHEWLSEVLMGVLYGELGATGLKLLKFGCTAATIGLIVVAESEAGAPAVVRAGLLVVEALILMPAMQFRPQLFDFVALAGIVALLARHNRCGRAPLWVAVPVVAVWSNFHGGFFLGLVALGTYGGAVGVCDVLAGRGWGRGLGIIALTAAAAASTLCTFLIPPARDTWHTLIHTILNPMTHYAIVDWVPLITSLKAAESGGFEKSYFVLVFLFFVVAAVTVIMTPRRADAPLVAVAAVMVAAAFAAVRNIPIAAIAVAPVMAHHLGLILGRGEAGPASAREMSRAGHAAVEILIVIAAIGLARHGGVLSPGIDASGNPERAVEFMKNHGLKGNVLTQFAWGQYVIWHGAPGMKVFIDSRYDLAYPPTVVWDWLEFASNLDGGSHTLAAYPHDFVLIDKGSPAVKLMDARRDWRLIYSDDTARLYARANSPAARLDGVPFKGGSGPVMFP